MHSGAVSIVGPMWRGPPHRYAFTIACYLEKVPKVALHKLMMAQPPWDSGPRRRL